MRDLDAGTLDEKGRAWMGVVIESSVE